MIRISTPTETNAIGDQKLMELADFLQQDEQEFLHSIESELDRLIKEPSEAIIEKILNYASLM